MLFAFDLISDLHLETWDQDFLVQDSATSPYCVVAGDVTRDRHQLVRALKQLSRCYHMVFYIDGNDEHCQHWHDLQASYQDLSKRINSIHNVVYLQNNVVVLNGVALLGTNGWWSFDFDPNIDREQSSRWFQERWQGQADGPVIEQITNQSNNDAIYLTQSIKKLQKHSDIKYIVMVTHTVPWSQLISHDISLSESMRFNVMGNNRCKDCLDEDSLRKIHTWCFGHYHMPIDTVKSGVRFVNNCRGRGDSDYRQWAYQPRRIEIEV